MGWVLGLTDIKTLETNEENLCVVNSRHCAGKDYKTYETIFRPRTLKNMFNLGGKAMRKGETLLTCF